MSKRMLIDASHPEETRVVVLDGSKVEEFDFEAASKRPLKGNIYLAKVTRVEPSLQAAFVEYGGNRQGFLAFSEIHPDYYQIPVADRIALLADQSRRRMADDDDIDAVATTNAPAQEPMALSASDRESSEHSEESAHADDDHDSHDGHGHDDHAHDDHAHDDHAHDDEDGEAEAHDPEQSSHDDAAHDENAHADAAPDNHRASDAVQTESTGTPVVEQRRERTPRPPRRRQYKIQEVIKRRQIMLVQVVKEERGNKGASLTTFLSLAGRYCVLMPNTPSGGGISRKITSATDRRRLKSAVQSLELPEGMGLIIRTAGANRTKVEIKRDYEYLLRLWDSVRELTLKSNAPALVYEEGNLIKRAIRDLYNKDIADIVVDGENGYRDAKDFMRMLMPSHAKNVKPYRESLPLFQSLHVEAQLDAMFSPTVTLKSGGYIVINQTEALVSIDVNSGRATREHSIEDTAYKTNLEAADEVGRQLRLRDLAGLIVIDFIDMEEGKNDRNVEKRLRDAVRGDRARVQIGKISQFGLLEMSRQRLRAGVLAGSTVTCPHCAGIGLVRSTESAALRLLRALDEEGQRQSAANITVRAPDDVVIYTLNQKRREIARIEDAYDLAILFDPKDGMAAGSFDIERTGVRAVTARPKSTAVSFDAGFHSDDAEDAQTDVTIAEPPGDNIADDTGEEAEDDRRGGVTANESGEQNGAGDGNGKKRRRRRRRGGRGRDQAASPNGQEGDAGRDVGSDTFEDSHADDGENDGQETDHPREDGVDAAASTPGEDGNEKRRRRRRRGRRGRRRDGDAPGQDGAPQTDAGQAQHIAASGEPVSENNSVTPDLPGSNSAEREPASKAPDFGIAPNAPSSPQWSLGGDHTETPRAALPETAPTPAPAEKPASAEKPAPAEKTGRAKPEATPDDAEMAEQGIEQRGETRKGWWQRRFGA